MYKADPAKAKVVFSSASELTSGLRSTATIRNKYKYAADEPEWLGGTDSAPNPVEMLLASLGTCQVRRAAVRDVLTAEHGGRERPRDLTVCSRK